MPARFEKIVGTPIDYETLQVGSWTQRLMAADRYRDYRVFLACDAAHLVIPPSGLGMKTGAGNAVDLAGKLSGVINGWGSKRLLDTYDRERQPKGIRNVAAALRGAGGRRAWRTPDVQTLPNTLQRVGRSRAHFVDVAEREQRWSNDLPGSELGYRYRDSPSIFDAVEGPDSGSFSYKHTSRPGTRPPHLWLDEGFAIHGHLDRCCTLICQSHSAVASPTPGEVSAGDHVPLTTFVAECSARRGVYGDYLIIWSIIWVPGSPRSLAR